MILGPPIKEPVAITAPIGTNDNMKINVIIANI